MATPMSAILSAGASFTPSPVMATMWPLRRRISTSRTLSSGATRAMTPMSSIAASASSSDIAANSAPVIARPSMPSWRAMASAVTAWSPVIIRTWMPAECAFAMASRRLGARRVDDADQRQELEVGHERQQVRVRVEGGRVEVPLGGGHDPQALRAESLVLGQVRARGPGRPGTASPSGPMRRRGARQELVGGALDVGADDGLARVVLHAVERGHELVGRVERQRRRRADTARG